MLYRSGKPDVPYVIDRPYAPDIVNRTYREDNLQLNPKAFGLYNQSSFFEIDAIGAGRRHQEKTVAVWRVQKRLRKN